MGFGQETARPLLEQVMHFRLRHESARQQDFRLRVKRPDFIKSLMASRLGHDHIQQHQVDLFRIRLVNFHGIQSVFGQKHRIAQLLQRLNQKIPDRFVVIHDQDGFRTGRKGFYGITHL